MDVKAEIRGGSLVVRVEHDRIDTASAIRFKELMRELVQTPAPVVVLDLSRVNFLDSSGLGAVVAVMKLLAPARRLELASLTPTVQKVFRLTRMDTIFKIHADAP